MHTPPLISPTDEGRWFSEGLGSAVFQFNKDLAVPGRIERFGWHSLVVQFYNSVPPLLNSQRIPSLTVNLQGSRVYQGPGVITGLIETGSAVMCEVGLDGVPAPLIRDQPAPSRAALAGSYHAFLSGWKKIFRLRSDYKLLVCDMQIFFTELRHFLEEIKQQNALGNERELCQMAESLKPEILPTISSFFEEFEYVSAQIENDLLPVHRAFMKRQLHPLVLCSPFAYRTFTKPLGYAGDYEMVNMIHRNRPEGGSLLAKVLNLWFLNQPPARAHRNRLDYLEKLLVQEALRTRALRRKLRVISLGCGPALEVQQFIRNCHLSSQAEYTLVDFNSETLEHLKGALGEVIAETSRECKIHPVKQSVVHFLKENKMHSYRESFDLVYCAGVFDYLSTQVCARLADAMYEWLAPGGLLLMTNVHGSNPLRHGMEHLLDWHLIYRDAGECQALRPSALPLDHFQLISESEGVNIFMEGRKPVD